MATKDKMIEHRFVVVRPSIEEVTFAIVEFEATEALSDAETRDRVIRALTGWVDETIAGRDAWAGSVEDFNIGDLAGELPDADIEARLASEGLHKFSLRLSSDADVADDWTYDTVLVNEQELEAEGDN